MKIYLLLAHPNRESFNGALADAYQRAVIAHGHGRAAGTAFPGIGAGRA